MRLRGGWFAGLFWGVGSRSRCRAEALRSAGAVLTGPGGSSPPCRLIRMVWSINESPHGLFPCPRSLRPDSEELSGACAPPPRSGDTVACVSENTNPAQTLTPRKPISPHHKHHRFTTRFWNSSANCDNPQIQFKRGILHDQTVIRNKRGPVSGRGA